MLARGAASGRSSARLLRPSAGAARCVSTPKAGAVFNTYSSETLDETKPKVQSLYRDTMRHLPRLNEDFALKMTPEQLRAVVRREFGRFTKVDDPTKVDLLTFKGRQHLEELKMQWKQRAQIMHFINDSANRKVEPGAASRSEFLSEFYAA